MNDRYLFRGKRLDGGEWVRGHYRSRTMEPNFDRIRHFISMDYPEIYEIDETTLGQCTGLKDKNSKLIFEHDVCKTKQYGKDNGKGANFNDFDIFVLKWHEGGFCIENSLRRFNLHKESASNCEIIGNVHDNPELLKEVS